MVLEIHVVLRREKTQRRGEVKGEKEGLPSRMPHALCTRALARASRSSRRKCRSRNSETRLSSLSASAAAVRDRPEARDQMLLPLPAKSSSTLRMKRKRCVCVCVSGGWRGPGGPAGHPITCNTHTLSTPSIPSAGPPPPSAKCRFAINSDLMGLTLLSAQFRGCF